MRTVPLPIKLGGPSTTHTPAIKLSVQLIQVITSVCHLAVLVLKAKWAMKKQVDGAEKRGCLLMPDIPPAPARIHAAAGVCDTHTKHNLFIQQVLAWGRWARRRRVGGHLGMKFFQRYPPRWGRSSFRC